MRIEKVSLCGFRNYSDTTIGFKSSTLIIGSNDVGKTNLIYGMRLLLDKSLSDADIEPTETDFHISPTGIQAKSFSITIHFCEVKEDAVLSVLKGHVSEQSSTIFKLVAQLSNLEYQLYIGATENDLELVSSRYYLRYINLRYINAQRNLQKFIEKEKKTLLKVSRNELDDKDSTEDQVLITKIGKSLDDVNEKVRELNYVKKSTALVNDELKKIAHTLSNYEVHLDTGAIQVQQFIDNLKLRASNNGSKMLLGGDGRNNQILLALWTAKSQRELNSEDEVVFYCIEEPEAHLHPHQQRKLADYLNNELFGQTIITTHSPQITARYSPDSIIHIVNRNSDSYAASGGCSDCISDAWDNLGYRMSILPAEAFFSRAVLLVEGPSEKLFYTELAEALGIDLDFYNISILTVDGVQFEVYVNVLDAMDIPWVLRTDNDVSKITIKNRMTGQDIEKRQLAGINRCLALANVEKMPHLDLNTTSKSLFDDGTWQNVSNTVNPMNIYLSKTDLEYDLSLELPHQLLEFSGKSNVDDAIKHLASKKAIRMREFLSKYGKELRNLRAGELAKPLLDCVNHVTESGV